jgi:acyl-CoA dehydrogenase
VIRRDLFTAEHDAFRAMVREFIEAEAVPHYAEWEKAGELPASFWKKMASTGVMGMAIPEKYGGAGIDDFRYNAIVREEAAHAAVTLGAVSTQLDVILPYFLAYADDAQRDRWFPGLASGELRTAIAMTEPGTGSDLAGMRTTAVLDGSCYVVNGAKTFITGGALAELVIVVARTAEIEGDRRAGLTLLVVEDGMPGFVRGRKLDKLGLKTQDTAELSFTGVRVPVSNRLGDEGAAFGYLGRNLPRERLAIAVGAVASARAALTLTVDYVRERRVFGQPVSQFQNTKFELASVATDIEAAQAFADTALSSLIAGSLSGADAAMVKLLCTETQGRVVDRCLQLFGGYGYITEFPIARLYADARVTRVFGGTSEVMKTIISKSLGL